MFAAHVSEVGHFGMPKILPPNSGEILPPERGLVSRLWSSLSPQARRKVAICGIAFPFAGLCFGLLLAALNQFFSLRGYTSVLASRIYLGLAFLAASLLALSISVALCALFEVKPRHRNLALVVVVLALAVLAILLDRAIPMPATVGIANTQGVRPSGWRVIQDWQKQRLGATLARYPGNTLRIIAASFSDEAWDYANQIKDVFRNHGWKVIGPETSPEDQSAIGVQLSVNQKYFGAGPPEAFLAVDSMLKSVDIKSPSSSPYVADPLVSPDELVIWVGANEPPGLPQGVPLRIASCQHPIAFTDSPMHFLDDKDSFGRLVKIKPPHSLFQAGDKMLVLLTGDAAAVTKVDSYQVQALGGSWPRPDALEVTIQKDFKPNEPLLMTVISNNELTVRCVEPR